MKILITGGAGYVGSKLVPLLLFAGHSVVVYDLFIFGETVKNHPRLIKVKGDIRDQELLDKSLKEIDTVIHLACISNDPSFELNRGLGLSINLSAFSPLFKLCQKNKVKRFIYASSSSVYGVKEFPNVTEDVELDPLTDYSKCKAECEKILLEQATDEMTSVIIRPATVCGYSPRLRLDLIVNIFASQALYDEKIIVMGGEQKRASITIDDMVGFYFLALSYPHEKVHKQIFNIGNENLPIDDIALMVKKEVGDYVKIRHVPTNDIRSYQISSQKAKEELDFSPAFTIKDAVRSLIRASEDDLIDNPKNNPLYRNIDVMRMNPGGINDFGLRS